MHYDNCHGGNGERTTATLFLLMHAWVEHINVKKCNRTSFSPLSMVARLFEFPVQAHPSTDAARHLSRAESIVIVGRWKHLKLFLSASACPRTHTYTVALHYPCSERKNNLIMTISIIILFASAVCSTLITHFFQLKCDFFLAIRSIVNENLCQSSSWFVDNKEWPIYHIGNSACVRTSARTKRTISIWCCVRGRRTPTFSIGFALNHAKPIWTIEFASLQPFNLLLGNLKMSRRVSTSRTNCMRIEYFNNAPPIATIIWIQ